MLAPELNPTPGAPDANSYVSLAEAVAYAASTTGPAAAAWLDLSPDKQAQSLITAARRLDEEDYAGRKAKYSQALQWPRVGARDEDGRPIPSSTVPRVVRAAQIEIAMSYGEGDPYGGGELDGYSAVKVGPISIDLRDGAKPGALPDQVRRLLRHVLRTGGSTMRLVRG